MWISISKLNVALKELFNLKVQKAIKFEDSATCKQIKFAQDI